MSGFDCQFTVKPANYLQSHCPICLLILREPFQVTCCGKSFCRACIQRIGARNKPCPTCNQDRFDSFQNKGLQQPLYGFQVFCSNKHRGCDWQGELGQLDQHLNLNPDKDKLSVGCAYTNVKCLFCNRLYRRSKIKHHQGSQCTERPFTCSMCEEYKSTYDNVVIDHRSVCKCRPVKCPNSCGANNLQHQHLEEHVSTQCPLSYVDCEFSDAGCDAKVHRKDLHSHMEENMVNHMSLLARENRKLKQLLKDQVKEIKEGFQEMELKFKVNTNLFRSRVAPLDLEFMDVQIKEPWFSKPFYNDVGGYKLCLGVYYKPDKVLFGSVYIESEFKDSLPCTQEITMFIIDKNGGDRFKVVLKGIVSKYSHVICQVSVPRTIVDKFLYNNHLFFHICKVQLSSD